MSGSEPGMLVNGVARDMAPSRPADNGVASPGDNLLVFLLAGERFAIFAASVVEIVRAVAIRPLPGAPAVVEGVIDCGGDILPVFDLRQRFGLPLRMVDPADHLIVAQAAARRVAVRVDRAESLAVLPPSGMTAASRLVTAGLPVVGALRLADGLVLIQDLDRFLDAAEQAALERAEAGS